ncbi:MAG: DNA polymerase III subunit beta [Bacillota bacterium]
MKFNISQKALSNGINKIKRAVSTKSTLPVLTGIYMKAEKNKGLHLIGTDLDLGIECWIEDITIEENGTIVLPADHFSSIIRELPPENINFNLDKEKLQMKLTCKKSIFKINGFDPEEFPQLPEVKNPSRIVLPADKLINIIEEVKFSISNNQSQPALTGALIQIEDDCLTMVSTNTYRLAYSENNIELENFNQDNNEINNVIIPGDTLNELSRLLPKTEEKVTISLGTNHTNFSFDKVNIISRLIEGQFPNYNQVIPNEYNTRIDVNKNNLQQAVKRASLIAALNSNEISLSLDEDTLNINSIESETGEAHEEITLNNIEGSNQNIKIDAGYLLDVLKIIDDETINLDFIGPVSPLTIKKETDNKKYIYLIMPIRQD